MVKFRISVGLLTDDAIDLIRATGLFDKKLKTDFDGGWIWIEMAEAKLIECLLEIANDVCGLPFRISLRMSPKLLAEVPYFQVFPWHTLKLKEADEDKAEDRFVNMDWGGCGLVNVLDPAGLELACRCEPGKLYTLVDGYNEIAVHRESAAVIQAITDSVFPVPVSRDGNCCLLVSRYRAPSICFDESIAIFDRHLDSGWPVQAGFLSLREKISDPGMYRLIDPLNGTGSSEWIASGEIVDQLISRGFKITRNYPVFDDGSHVQAEYKRVIVPLVAMIQENPLNTLCLL